MTSAEGSSTPPSSAGAEGSVTAPGAARLWVWEAMDSKEQAARLDELGEWVAWLVRTFALESQLAPCWFLHPDVVEHLTALYLGWVRTYSLPAEGKTPERVGELDWLARFHIMVPHLATRTCGRGHAERVAVPWTFKPQLMRIAIAEERKRRVQTGVDRVPRNPAAFEMARYQHAVSAANAGQRAHKGAAQQQAQGGGRPRRARAADAGTPASSDQTSSDAPDPATLARIHRQTVGGLD